MTDIIRVIGIESSCDETSIAIIDSEKNILSHNTFSQLEEHKKYGGVMPEIASRMHLAKIRPLIEKTMSDSQMTFQELDGISATGGPGLIGGLMVGIMTAKTMSSMLKKPFIAINHLEAHALTIRLTNTMDFPFLLLLISGGHCQILIAKDVGKYELLGETIDDALGECFDKVARMLGFEYPGGPIIEKMAKLGDESAFKFPEPLFDRKDCDFSFSGLKTSIRYKIESMGEINGQTKCDICASFQKTIRNILLKKLNVAIKIMKEKCPQIEGLVVSGGVASNKYIISAIRKEMEKFEIATISPPIDLCTDNGAMIAWAGVEYLARGKTTPLDFSPKPNWNLETLSD